MVLNLIAASKGGCEKKIKLWWWYTQGKWRIFRSGLHTHNLSHLFFFLYFLSSFLSSYFSPFQASASSQGFFFRDHWSGSYGFSQHQYHHLKNVFTDKDIRNIGYIENTKKSFLKGTQNYFQLFNLA